MSLCPGSIPAGAGEPRLGGLVALPRGVYPRGCGGTWLTWVDLREERGLSPRVRGNRAVLRERVLVAGSIPAGAGEPDTGRGGPRRTAVYPRGCGGTIPRGRPGGAAAGLSPRVRGNQPDPLPSPVERGSIPAGAGEPWSRLSSPLPGTVYPRGCGGTKDGRTAPKADTGLSPRVRGNLKDSNTGVGMKGSIPAGAGEPIERVTNPNMARVYPRGCGGTVDLAWPGVVVDGLSPRVRGNHRRPSPPVASMGSIPAGAGEPTENLYNLRYRGVYPRGCGGTWYFTDPPPGYTGLSPRVRGNLDRPQGRSVGVGSIPAGAGEPSIRPRSGVLPRVYPRGCGGTAVDSNGGAPVGGLSPRVRGNLLELDLEALVPGSIPAGAGEPGGGPRTSEMSKVYPRGCGGTSDDVARFRAARGLSPRVRGNPYARDCSGQRCGSIPAGAGEPSSRAGTRCRRRVYPRGCGGTMADATNQLFMRGLSPRVRGNLPFLHVVRQIAGSIPAGAGEPLALFTGHALDGVYPRGCGGTLLDQRGRTGSEGLSPRVRGNPASGA